MLWQLLLLALAVQLLLFVPAYLLRTDKLTDFSYALTFILLALLAAKAAPTHVVLVAMIVLWALRLGTFLVIRITATGKDKRFDGVREHALRFLGFWLLQGLTVWIVMLPSLMFFESGERAWMLGSLVWLVGVIIETAADAQKLRFRQQHTGRWIETGLWKYSRHPNYFGEILCWVGIYVFVFPGLSVIQRVFGALGPVFIAVLLIFFSGVPPLEKYADKRWGHDPKYQKYKQETSTLVPWPRR